METPLDIAIVGCGLIGRKRATQLAGGRLVMACDLDQSRADGLAALVPGCRATADLAEALRSSAQVIIVATANHALAPLALEAVKAGKHVLIEKPGAIRASELETTAPLVRKKKLKKNNGVKSSKPI